MAEASAKNTPRKSPWLKAVLIPFWVIQLLFMCILLGLQIWVALAGLEAAALLEMIICAVCVILDVTEIILFAKANLQPVTYLVFQCVKTTMWFIIFLITVVADVRDESVSGGAGWGGVFALIGLIEAVVLLLAYLSTLIYASVIYHRHRRSKHHHHSVSALDHERYARFYNGPYGETGIVEAHYRSDGDGAEYTEGSPTMYGCGPSGPFESAGEELLRWPLPCLGYGQETAGEGEVHELAASRSLRSCKGGLAVRAGGPLL